MSFHLRILNLRNDATEEDLRTLFSGMVIAADGVSVIGGPQGEAFITFGDQMDLLRAMQKDGHQNLKFQLATNLDRLEAINKMYMAKLQMMKEMDARREPRYTALFDENVHNITGNERYSRHDPYTETTAKVMQQNIPDYYMDQRTAGNSGTRELDYSARDNYPFKRSLDYIDIEGDDDNLDSYDMKRSRRDQTDNSYCHGDDGDYKGSSRARDWGSERGESRDLHNDRFRENTQSYSHLGQQTLSCPNVPQPNWTMGSEQNTPGYASMPQQPQILQGSLFRALSPNMGIGSGNCSIMITDLPADITANRVYKWVGGPSGQSVGVILLKPSNDTPVAFAIYQDESERDRLLYQSVLKMEPYSKSGTFHFVLKFLNNWMAWKGARKLVSPIFETTHSGHERSVTFSDIDNLMGVPAMQSTVNPVKRNNVKPPVPVQHPNEDQRHFLVIYQMIPTASASEMLSWFSDGMSAMKLDFPKVSGPRESESMGFVLFPNKPALKNAEGGLAGKGFSVGRYKFAAGFRFIARLGDTCIITKTSPGGDRAVLPKERRQPPFLQPSVTSPSQPFTLTESAKLIYLHLKAFNAPYTANQVWSWFTESKGVVMVLNNAISSSALVAFATHDDRYNAVGMIMKRTSKGKSKQWKGQKSINGTEALSFLAQCSGKPTNRVKLSTPTRQDRDLSIQEANLLVKLRKTSTVNRPKNPEAESVPVAKSIPKSTSYNTSFIHHLKTPDGVTGDEPLFLGVHSLNRKETACRVLSWFKDGVCCAKLNFHETGPKESKAMAYILFKTKQARDDAKLQYSSRQNQGGMHSLKSVKGNFTSLKRIALEGILSRVCHTCTISESSPSGMDKPLTMQELARVPINPPFTLDSANPWFYAQIEGVDLRLSACEVWARFGEGRGLTKGVVTSVSTDGESSKAQVYLACKSMEERVEVLKTRRRDWNLKPVDQRQVFNFLKQCPDEINVSTETGQDRGLEPDELDF